MPREKFQTLTEQMFYVLLCLQNECCGTDIMEMVRHMTDGRVQIGPGTLYNLLEKFLEAGMIEEAAAEGRKRSYRMTAEGRKTLDAEFHRLQQCIADYSRFTAWPEAAAACLERPDQPEQNRLEHNQNDDGNRMEGKDHESTESSEKRTDAYRALPVL